ncbi:MAG TPA: 3-dehydroquinate synthase, partial [Polyangiaceae bacterium]|nr:3-dehydroquinate synthase [Polyangiaceae bacterium]
RVIRLLARLGLPTDLAAEPVEGAIRLLARDKKRRGSTLRAVLLRRIGEPLLHRIDVGDLGARYLRAAAARP